MNGMQCRVCGGSLPRGRQKFCSTACDRQSRLVATKIKKCAACNIGFESKRVSRKFCSTACRRQSRLAATKIKKCAACNIEFESKRVSQKFCSTACHSRSVATKIKQCAECNIEFETKRVRQKFCSARCHKKFRNESRRYKPGVKVRSVTRDYIMDRDNGLCQLCGERVEPMAHRTHPLYPELDHITPLSKGGDHCRENVWLTHRECNAQKGDAYWGRPIKPRTAIAVQARELF